MKLVGFQGGSSVFELGVTTDMYCFFSLIKERIGLDEREKFLVDRLFRKYLRFDGLDNATALILKIKISLSEVPCDTAVLKKFGWSKEESLLKIECENFAEMFERYFESYEHCVKSAKYLYDDWGLYRPVKVSCSEEPFFTLENLRPLEDYDNLALDSLPFWMR